jgi:hypothetical protein
MNTFETVEHLRSLGFEQVFPCDEDKRPKVRWQDAPPPGGWPFREGDLVGVAMPPATVALDVDDMDTFRASGLETTLAVFQGTRRGTGLHVFYRTDGRDVPQQNASHTLGYDTRVGGKGYVICWEPERWKPVADWPAAPAWLYESPHTASTQTAGGDAPMGTRADILSFLGRLAVIGGLTEADYLAVLRSKREQGAIIDLDPARPWTDEDFRVLAREASEWPAHENLTLIPNADFPAGTISATAAPAPVEGALTRVHAKPLGLINRDPAAPLLVNRLSPDGHTIIFGPGDSGKGLLASKWIVQHVQEHGRVLILDFEDHEEEWARRIFGLGGAAMLGTDADAPIFHVPPLRYGQTRWEDLYAAAQEHRSTLIAVDSVAYAIPGTDPSEAKAATAYSALIQPFGLPVLSLAHMNRQGDERYPFGSVFWHAGARITWGLKPEADGETSRLTNRKHNNYPWQGAYIMSSEWYDGLPREVNERAYAMTVADRIAGVLNSVGMSVDDIVEALAEDEMGDPVKSETVSRTLRRGLKNSSRQPWTVVDGLWRRTADEASLRDAFDQLLN